MRRHSLFVVILLVAAVVRPVILFISQTHVTSDGPSLASWPSTFWRAAISRFIFTVSPTTLPAPGKLESNSPYRSEIEAACAAKGGAAPRITEHGKLSIIEQRFASEL
jgi:hypothetical protein